METTVPDALDRDAAYANSYVGEVLEKLDRELVGLSSVKTRIREIAHPKHIDFPDYAEDELLSIAHLTLGALNDELTPSAERAFVKYIAPRLRQPQFANARSIRNAIDRARLRQATRLVERGGTVTTTDLESIDESDIRRKPVFAIGSA